MRTLEENDNVILFLAIWMFFSTLADIAILYGVVYLILKF